MDHSSSLRVLFTGAIKPQQIPRHANSEITTTTTTSRSNDNPIATPDQVLAWMGPPSSGGALASSSRATARFARHNLNDTFTSLMHQQSLRDPAIQTNAAATTTADRIQSLHLFANESLALLTQHNATTAAAAMVLDGHGTPSQQPPMPHDAPNSPNQQSLATTSSSITTTMTTQQAIPFSGWELVLISLLISIIVISIVGNCLVCIAIFTDRRLRKLGNAFIVSLAIADLFVSCLVMTFALCNDLMNYWMFGEWFCDIWISFDIMCCTASILNMCAISLDRFVHIKDCLLYNQLMTKRVAISAVILIWIISALVSFVPINLGWHKPNHFKVPRNHNQQQQQQQQFSHMSDSQLQMSGGANLQRALNSAEPTNELDYYHKIGPSLSGDDDAPHKQGPNTTRRNSMAFQQTTNNAHSSERENDKISDNDNHDHDQGNPTTTTRLKRSSQSDTARGPSQIVNELNYSTRTESEEATHQMDDDEANQARLQAGQEELKSWWPRSWLWLSPELKARAEAKAKPATAADNKKSSTKWTQNELIGSPAQAIASQRRRATSAHEDKCAHSESRGSQDEQPTTTQTRTTTTTKLPWVSLHSTHEDGKFTTSRPNQVLTGQSGASSQLDNNNDDDDVDDEGKHQQQQRAFALYKTELFDPRGQQPQKATKRLSELEQLRQPARAAELPSPPPPRSLRQRRQAEWASNKSAARPQSKSARSPAGPNQVQTNEGATTQDESEWAHEAAATKGPKFSVDLDDRRLPPANSDHHHHHHHQDHQASSQGTSTSAYAYASSSTTQSQAPQTTSDLPQCMLTLTPTYAVISSAISFYIPCIIMLGLYSKLFACARRHVRSIKAITKAPQPISGGGGGGIRSPPQAPTAHQQQTTRAGMKAAGNRLVAPTNPIGPNDHQEQSSCITETSCGPATAMMMLKEASAELSHSNRMHQQQQQQQNLASGSGKSALRRLVNRPGLKLGDKARTWIKFGTRNSKPFSSGPAKEFQGPPRLQGQEQGLCRGIAVLERPRDDKTIAPGGSSDESEPFLGPRSNAGGGRLERDGHGRRASGCKVGQITRDGGVDADVGRVNSQEKSCDREAAKVVLVGLQRQLEVNSELTATKLAHVHHAPIASPQISTTTFASPSQLASSNNNNNNNNHQQQQQQQQPTKQQTNQLATHKAAITLGIIMGTFLFCWVPFFCLNIIKAFHGDSIPASLFRAFTWLGYANSALNPIIYGIHNTEFRHAFNRIFFKHFTLKNGRQYLNRRFSYDVRQHHNQNHHHH